MRCAILLLGCNLGDCTNRLLQAETLLAEKAGQIVGRSSLYASEPWGVEDQPDYLNRAVMIETALSPELLLECCLSVENILGRVRTERWGSRTMDVDILFVDDLVFQSNILELPHPRIQSRKFALLPLSELVPEFEHPVLKQTIIELLDACTDTGKVEKIA